MSYINDPVRYEQAIAARIKANAAKTRRRAMEATEDGRRVLDFLEQTGEFAPIITKATDWQNTHYVDFDDAVKQAEANPETKGQNLESRLYAVGFLPCFDDHPIVKINRGDFRSKMVMALRQWGGLTEGQTAAVIRMINKGEQRIAEREAMMKKKAATAKHVGEIKERRDFTLTVKFKTSFETEYGYLYVLVCEDEDQNTIVYKGSAPFASKGQTVTVKATVKAHDVRDGIAQTIINRPKVID